MNQPVFFAFSLLISCLTAMSCQPKAKRQEAPTATTSVPAFSGDSAYQHVARQVAFGPRVPNTDAHRKCADYIAETLEQYGATVIRQTANLTAFDGTVLHAVNIIGQYAPERQRRILLCAHWDSRPFSDAETDATLHHQPIDGANDGASGVGVLLEMARHLRDMQLNAGIDIILFDAEDYGTPRFHTGEEKEDTWCLGSQYWARHPHTAGYKAEYGILLDMVGAPDALFTYEYFSYQAAAHVMEKVWKKAGELGYGQWFQAVKTYPITDDHYYINTIARIPCIDIIHHDPYSPHGFGDYWHTQEDNMSRINKATLEAVGNTLLHILAEE